MLNPFPVEEVRLITLDVKAGLKKPLGLMGLRPPFESVHQLGPGPHLIRSSECFPVLWFCRMTQQFLAWRSDERRNKETEFLPGGKSWRRNLSQDAKDQN